MPNDFDAKLTNEYLAMQPTVENSRDIVKILSKKHSISEGKVRSSLVRTKVYISQPRRGTVATPEQVQEIRQYLAALGEGVYANTFDMAAKFNLTYDAVYQVESDWRFEKSRAARALEEAQYDYDNSPSIVRQIISLIDESGKATGGCMVWIATAGCFIVVVWAIFALGIAILQSSG